MMKIEDEDDGDVAHTQRRLAFEAHKEAAAGFQFQDQLHILVMMIKVLIFKIMMMTFATNITNGIYGERKICHVEKILCKCGESCGDISDFST